jgi:hypothetical protein
MNVITTKEITKLLDAHKGKIFSVAFLKGTTNPRNKCKPREMTCREGVRRYVKGNGKSNSRMTHLTVFEVNTKREAAANYRSIILSTIYRLKVGGTVYEVCPS